MEFEAAVAGIEGTLVVSLIMTSSWIASLLPGRSAPASSSSRARSIRICAMSAVSRLHCAYWQCSADNRTAAAQAAATSRMPRRLLMTARSPFAEATLFAIRAGDTSFQLPAAHQHEDAQDEA